MFCYLEFKSERENVHNVALILLFLNYMEGFVDFTWSERKLEIRSFKEMIHFSLPH